MLAGQGGRGRPLPYTTLFRSQAVVVGVAGVLAVELQHRGRAEVVAGARRGVVVDDRVDGDRHVAAGGRDVVGERHRAAGGHVHAGGVRAVGLLDDLDGRGVAE